jgi:hypothetical protein
MAHQSVLARGRGQLAKACRRIAVLATAVAGLGVLLAPPAAAVHTGTQPGLRQVIFAGSNWAGTVDVISPHPRYRRIARINMIPDIQERMLEMAADPVRFAHFLLIRELIGEGHHQWVDDMFSTNDGRLLIASRPSLADVVAINLATGEVAWRTRIDGQRADHMAISPDGRHVAVSAQSLTTDFVQILDTRTGKEVGRFVSGDAPHENNYSADGRRIYHASIGLVIFPSDNQALDSQKGDRWFQVVRSRDNKILKRIDMGKKLEQAGHPNMSSAVRPMAISPDERFAYFQVSFFHGFVEYDLRRDRVLRLAHLPLSEEVRGMSREQYLLDSAHHGIAMNGAGTKLCVAGTMSDYAAIVSRRNFRRFKLIHGGEKPYWATTSNDGRYCFVSWSGSDRISIISYRTEREVARVPVDDHPQRVRMGNVRVSWLRAQG